MHDLECIIMTHILLPLGIVVPELWHPARGCQGLQGSKMRLVFLSLSESFQLGTCEAPSMPSGTIVAVRPREHHEHQEHQEHHQQRVDHSATGINRWCLGPGLQTTTSMHLPMVMRHTSSHNFSTASDQPSVELSAQAAPPPPVQYGCNSMGNGFRTFKHCQY